MAELESSKKQAEADKKAIDDLVRERDILNKVQLYAMNAPACSLWRVSSLTFTHDILKWFN